jgi:hypothetical protein
MEWKLFEGLSSEFTTSEWHKGREAAHHLEQADHKERLHMAAGLVMQAMKMGAKTAVDLGCGDGGMLQLLKNSGIKAWGYDLTQTNVDYAVNVRGVDARYTDFNSGNIEYGDVAIMTEVLEHMADPHKVVKELPSKFLVASSPYNENDVKHYEFHLWAWDKHGYDNLFILNGYRIVNKLYASGWSQIVLAVRDE